MHEQARAVGIGHDLGHDTVRQRPLGEHVADESIAPHLDREEPHRRGQDDARLLWDDRDRPVDLREVDQPIEGRPDGRNSASEMGASSSTSTQE